MALAFPKDADERACKAFKNLRMRAESRARNAHGPQQSQATIWVVEAMTHARLRQNSIQCRGEAVAVENYSRTKRTVQKPFVTARTLQLLLRARTVTAQLMNGRQSAADIAREQWRSLRRARRSTFTAPSLIQSPTCTSLDGRGECSLEAATDARRL